MKKYFKYFNQKPGLWLLAIIVIGLLGGMFFLDLLAARHAKTMIGDLEDPVDAFSVKLALIRGGLTGAVMIVFIFLLVNGRARFGILEREVKATTKFHSRQARRLKRSEEKYRSLVESADDIIYTMDQFCNILSINRSFTKLIGRPAAELIGKGVTDVVEYRSPADISSIVKKVLHQSKMVVLEEQVKIGDKAYWLNTKYQAVGSGRDAPSLVLVISRDISDQKRIEQRLFQAEKLASLGALSAGVAHEINNPLAVILGFTELLMDKVPEGSKEHEIHKTIHRQGSNCKRIIENLLAFSRIPEKVIAEADVAHDLQRVFNLVMNTLTASRIEPRMEIEKNLPKVRADGRQLEKVFLNIVNNAVASMDSGGVLTLSAKRSDDMVSIAFSDTGCGIAPENMDRIFEPFFTTRGVGEGSGLGLSLSYGIIKMFGGDIRVVSQTGADGKESGTTVTVLLPVADAGPGAKPAPDRGLKKA